jgi:hypothetical protein
MARLDVVIRELQQQRDKIDEAIQALTSLGSGGARSRRRRPGQVMSPAARKRIAEAQRSRWRAWRQRARVQNTRESNKPKRRQFSPETLAKMRTAQRARWAKVKRAKKK